MTNPNDRPPVPPLHPGHWQIPTPPPSPPAYPPQPTTYQGHWPESVPIPVPPIAPPPYSDEPEKKSRRKVIGLSIAAVLVLGGAGAIIALAVGGGSSNPKDSLLTNTTELQTEVQDGINSNIVSYNKTHDEFDSLPLITDMTCIRTSNQLFTCDEVYDDGTNGIVHVTVAADGQSWISSN